MTPVAMATVEYYWRQGWPKEMLLYLFIKGIEIEDPNGRWRPYDNDPEDQVGFTRFQEQIRTKDWKWGIEVDPNLTRIGVVDANEASKLKDLIEAQKAGLRLAPVEGKNKNEVHFSQVRYVFTREEKEGGEKTTSKKMIFASPDSQSGNMGDKLYGRIYIRSPEAILYYLGEILRVETQAENEGKCPKVPKVHSSHGGSRTSSAWLFYARKATDKNAVPCVSVDYEGTKYVIPGERDPDDIECTDRSMHVLSLVSQLIGLQKKSQQLPATGVVTVIGR
jgi:hypothetical protein